MKKLLLLAAAILAGLCCAAQNISVQACTDNIYRVRISPRAEYSESLMERYGILKTDWEPVKNPSYKIKVDKRGHSLKVLDSKGNVVIDRITFNGAGAPVCTSLAKVINDKFGGINTVSNGGIIGDDDGSISEKDKTESGDPDKSCVLSISLKDGERFYGAGSTSREHIQHRGELLRIHTTYVRTEIPMPFLVSSEGWGIFNNTTRKNYFDVGYTDSDKLNLYTPCDEIDFYLFLGDSMADVINYYTLLTGRPYVLPKWAYGLCFGPNMREDQWDILNDAVHFRQFDVPCDLFWLEPQWMEKRYDFSTEKKFNTQRFAVEPYWIENEFPKKFHNRLFIGKLRNMGFHLGLWLCEEYDLSVQEEDDIALREGRDTSGQYHWMDHLKTFIDLGVEGFKLDPARTIDEHTYRKYYNGRTDKEMHNLNQILLPKQMRELTQNYTGKRSWHHYCAGWSGTQHWGASTSGDNGGGKTALFDQINLGMSGFMNTSCDVMSVEKELEMQSLHFGMFLPWIQINSWFSMMQPFYYNDFEQTLYRNCVKLRYELIPYVYSAALEGAQTGMPMVRSMPLMFPEDRNVDDMWHQYMFGGSFCVGIFTNDIYLPKGSWYDAWTDEKIVSGGEVFTRSYPEDRAGLLFVREGAIVPCQHEVQYIGTKPISSFVLKVYPGAQSSSYVMYDSDAESYGYENGLIASTKFECIPSGRGVEFIINPVEGSFENMPQVREYEMELRTDVRPEGVSVNGKDVEGWSWDGKKLNVSLGEVPVTEAVSVKVL